MSPVCQQAEVGVDTPLWLDLQAILVKRVSIYSYRLWLVQPKRYGVIEIVIN